MERSFGLRLILIPPTTFYLNYAIQLEHEHPRKSLKELKKAKTPKDWSTSHFEDPYGII
jgi:hypothetical protein